MFAPLPFLHYHQIFHAAPHRTTRPPSMHRYVTSRIIPISSDGKSWSARRTPITRAPSTVAMWRTFTTERRHIRDCILHPVPNRPARSPRSCPVVHTNALPSLTRRSIDPRRDHMEGCSGQQSEYCEPEGHKVPSRGKKRMEVHVAGLIDSSVRRQVLLIYRGT